MNFTKAKHIVWRDSILGEETIIRAVVIQLLEQSAGNLKKLNLVFLEALMEKVEWKNQLQMLEI